jgi:CubicO group peptidase (beta-lactamase class C family)
VSKPAKKPAAPATAPVAGPAAIDALFAGLQRDDTPGAVVGVAQHGQAVYRRGFGMASLEHGVANAPATRMRIGSSSKQFTCLAAFLLADDGLLDIDAAIGRYIPELPPLQGRPTLRQLMQHTGGLRDYLDLGTSAAGLAMQAPGSALAAQLRQTEVNFPPGAGQIYCNGGYHLLSVAIARAAGMPFEQVLKERIFDPLGLHDTASEPSDMRLIPRMATQHVPAVGGGATGGWQRGIFPTEEVRGEGAMVSTVDDMLAWLAELRGPHRLGSDHIWQQMLQTAVLANGLHSSYACGLWRRMHRGIEIVYHSGNVYGGACQLLSAPAHALDVVVITNGALVNPVALSTQIVEALLPGHLRGQPTRMAGNRRFRHLAGVRYASPDGLVIGFDNVGDKLGISLQTSGAAPILRDEGRSLCVAFEDVAIGPFELAVADLAAGSDGKARRMLPVRESGQVSTYRRLPARAPATAVVGMGLLGAYHSVDLDADGLVEFDADGALTLTFSGPAGSRRHTLTALSADVFAVLAQDERMPDRWALTVLREAGGVTGFRFSTGRTRRLLFSRVQGAGT